MVYKADAKTPVNAKMTPSVDVWLTVPSTVLDESE
jgi:hypothetical protein